MGAFLEIRKRRRDQEERVRGLYIHGSVNSGKGTSLLDEYVIPVVYKFGQDPRD